MTKQPNTPQQGQGGQQQQYQSGQPRFAEQIREHMPVVGADGGQIGKVDSVEGDRIKLTRADWQNDGAPGASHHFVPLEQVSAIENNQVRLNLNAEAARQQATRA